MICYANDKTSFSHKLSLTNKQVSSLCDNFANNSYATTMTYTFKTYKQVNLKVDILEYQQNLVSH